MTATFSTISVELKANVARIALKHPLLNVITLPMMEELTCAMSEIEGHPGSSVIVFSSGGDSFSAGVDVAAHAPDKVELMLSKFHAVIRMLIASKKVTLASVRGNCLGGAAELAMACDLVYTAESARWGFPEINLACFPPVACTALAALVGQKRAAKLILTGHIISGSEAANYGLATQAVPDGMLDATVEAALQRLSELSPAALAVTKKATYAWDSMHFDKGLVRAEKIYLEELTRIPDMQEGVNAFLEKRKPRWSGT
jgi:cyclohexa-1,5-dienecarbonyl-CoA hydratase